MKKIKNLAIISLLFLTFSCSNKVSKHISLMEKFIDKWEEKLNRDELSADEITEVQKDMDEIMNSSHAIYENQSEFSPKQLEELNNMESKYLPIQNKVPNR